MFKQASSSLSLSIALLLVFSITFQGFARATGTIVSAKTANVEKSAATDVQKESGTGVSPVNQAQDARATRPLTRLANRNSLMPMAPMPFLPTITATLDHNFPLGSKKNPGDTINYTAVISNIAGTDASGVAYTDTR